LPPRPDNDATAVVRTPRDRVHFTQDTLIEGTPRVQVSVGPGGKGLSGRSMILGMLGAAVIAAGIAVGAILLTRPADTAPKEPRFLLVERPGQANAPDKPEAAPEKATPS